MLPADAKIISVDDHVIEHPRLWLDRLPTKYGEAARSCGRGHRTPEDSNP
jgi:hypothetical protein